MAPRIFLGSRITPRRTLLLPVVASALSVFLATVALAERVARVVDGDTIVLVGGERVRYIGIDTPETVHPQKPVEFMGKEASAFNHSLVEGKDVRLEYDIERKDRYGRTLAYVYLDTLFVNAELVRQGFAQVMTIPPNVKYADLFLELQQEAREAGRGLWGEAVATAIRAPPVERDTATCYVTRTGEKYHRAGCRYLRSTAIPISKADAIARGHTPCSVCIGGVAASLRPSTGTTVTSGRCQAITKKGTQCKRKAKAGSIYCWQHGG